MPPVLPRTNFTAPKAPAFCFCAAEFRLNQFISGARTKISDAPGQKMLPQLRGWRRQRRLRIERLSLYGGERGGIARSVGDGAAARPRPISHPFFPRKIHDRRGNFGDGWDCFRDCTANECETQRENNLRLGSSNSFSTRR